MTAIFVALAVVALLRGVIYSFGSARSRDSRRRRLSSIGLASAIAGVLLMVAAATTTIRLWLALASAAVIVAEAALGLLVKFTRRQRRTPDA